MSNFAKVKEQKLKEEVRQKEKQKEKTGFRIPEYIERAEGNGATILDYYKAWMEERADKEHQEKLLESKFPSYKKIKQHGTPKQIAAFSALIK